MNIDFIHRIGLMVFFILVQVLILNHIHLFNVATPLVYVYFILLFPRNQQRWVSVLWAFFFGLILDSFSNTPGETAFALTLIAFLQPYFVGLYLARDNSDNHIMFGDIGAWFHRSLGGILPDPESPGFKHILLRPCFPKGLDSFSCSYDSPYGRIEVSWVRKGRNASLRAVIPCGASATFHSPDGNTTALPSGTHEISIKLSGRP